MHSTRSAWLTFAALLAGLTVPATLSAQLAVNRSNTPVLVMEPIPVSGVDSAYALALADGIRDRMSSKYRFQLRVIPTETICEAKEASGFTCDFIFPAGNAPALSRFLQAQGYVTSWIERRGDSLHLRVRMVSSAGAGLAGWTSFSAPAGEDPDAFGRRVAEGLEEHVEAAEDARECDQRRAQSDFRRARERATDAFERFPNHPAAAQCAALLFEVMGQPIDSVIWAMRKAVTGDSADGSAWETLGRRLIERGDTTEAINAFLMQLRAQPTNITLARGIAGQMLLMGRHVEARELIEPFIEFNPDDLVLLSLREQACYDGEMWSCAMETMEHTFSLDTLRQQSLDFKFRAFSGAQSWEETASDSAIPYLLTWSERLVEHDSSNIDAWRARSQAMIAAGRPLDAVGVYRQMLALDSTLVSAAYAAANILWDTTALVIDSTVPLDTARLFLGDSLWTRVTQLTSDTVTWTTIAVQYYQLGSKLVLQRMRLPFAHRLEMRALELDLEGRLVAPANFFAGYADFLLAFPMYQRLRESERCADIPPFVEHVRRTRRELETGRSAAQQAVDQQFLPRVAQLESTFEALRANFCR